MSTALGASGGGVTFGSLFAGIGGFDLALERAGLSCAWQCEIDPAARSVLARHWPDVRRFEDVRELGAETPSVDVLCGGWPCQDLSVAGNRAGLAGERSGLFREVVRIAALLAPRWLLLENVPGLLSSNGGRDMGAVLWSLGQLGYRWAYRVLDAQHFGVPQRRRRVFIVGSLGAGCPGEVLFEPDRLPWDLAPRGEAGKGVAAVLAGGARGRGWRVGADEAAGGQVVAAQCHGSNVGPMGHLRRGNSNETGGVPFVAFDETQITSRENRCNPAPGDPSHPLAATGRPPTIAFSEVAEPVVASYAKTADVGDGSGADGRMVAVAFNVQATYAEGRGPHARAAEVTKCLDGHGGNPDSQQGGSLVHGSAVRRLTPRECERLQGFPDDWTRLGALSDKGDEERNKPWWEQSDSARYRMIGNGVAVPVVEWIAHRIAAVDAAAREAAA